MREVKKRVALHNLGCKVNAYETEAMRQQLEECGFEIVQFHERADVYIVNTCTVTNIADRKSRQMLRRPKKNNPDAIVVAVGCYVQAAGEEIEKDDAINIVIGNNQKNDLSRILEQYLNDRERNPKATAKLVIDINKGCEYEPITVSDMFGHTRAYIKIQDGCNQFCAYCIIPIVRGRARSRKLEEIEREVSSLVEKGYKEIVLTGIHLSSYGIDFSDRKYDLLSVIKILHAIEGIERIRLGSLEPLIITESFVSELSKFHKVCPHFHLSLQSGCDKTLQRMNRKYKSDQYINICNLLRKHYRNPAITTDIIVGFPGEDEEEFHITKQFLKCIGFAEMHVFKYSKRSGTKAADMEGQIEEGIKQFRSNELINLAESMTQTYKESLLNHSVRVLIEENILIDHIAYQTGYTSEYVKVAILSDKDYTNQIIDAKIIKILNCEILLAEIKNIY